MRFLMIDKCISKVAKDDDELASKDSLKERSSTLSYIQSNEYLAEAKM